MGKSPKAIQKSPIERKPQVAKIDLDTAKEVAALVAKGLTEKEAIAKLNRGINVANWYNWKDRNKDKYSEVLTRIRANKLESLLEQVEDRKSTRLNSSHRT